jgi:hypothetical protein
MRAASPIRHISAALPPTLLVVGESDIPMLEGDAASLPPRPGGPIGRLRRSSARGGDHMGVVRSLVGDDIAIQEEVLAFLRKLEDEGK